MGECVCVKKEGGPGDKQSDLREEKKGGREASKKDTLDILISHSHFNIVIHCLLLPDS